MDCGYYKLHKLYRRNSGVTDLTDWENPSGQTGNLTDFANPIRFCKAARGAI